MQKRYTYLFVVLGIAVIAAVAGIALTPPSPAVPNKVLLPNAGGRVVFTHQQHAEDYGLDCATCHHENAESRPDPLACGACHGQTSDADFVKTHTETFKDDPQACLTCHHQELASTNWDEDVHQLHIDILDVEDGKETNCQSCHHDSSIEPEPMACSDCHERLETGKPVPTDPDPILYRDAVHARCASCHTETHSESFDKGIKGCADCHESTDTRKAFIESGKDKLSDDDIAALSSCATCHFEPPVEEIFPNRMQAFHQQCGSCHADMGGPSVESDDKQCNQCHIR